MKSIFSYGKRLRSLILIVFAVIIVVAGGLAIGNETSTVLQESQATCGFYVNFGTGSHYSGLSLLTATQNSGYVRFTASSTNGDAFFYPGTGAANLSAGGCSTGSFAAATYKYGILRYRTLDPDVTFMLYHGTAVGTVDGTRNARFSSVIPDGRWHDLVLDMSAYSNWTGTIAMLRLDIDGLYSGNYVDLAVLAFHDTSVATATSWASKLTSLNSISLPKSVDHGSLTTTNMTGSISMSGGSTSTDDYTSAPSTRRFYRSNLNQYLTFDGTATSMNFAYSSVTAPATLALPDGTSGRAVAKIAVNYSSSTTATGNNADGAIQWTYVTAASGTVNFQTSTVSLGSYYDQDVSYSGYSATDGAVYKGDDKYQYQGSFAHNVLPPGTYKASLQYDVLYDKYVVVQCSTSTSISADPFDGNNMRKWPGAAELQKNKATVSDTDGLITTIPTGVNIYVGYDSTDTSQAQYWTANANITTAAKAGTMSLYGGVFHPANASNVAYASTHVWRMAKCVIDGVLYEGWIDTHYTNYWTLVTSTTDTDIKATSSATGLTLNMVPRKYDRTDLGEYNYGTWSPWTYTKASTSDFAVRWSWSFNTEQNVKDYTKSNSTAETSNSYYTGAQVEYNTNGYVTLTSTSAAGSTQYLRMNHVFTKSQTYDDYDVDKAAGWATGNAIASASAGLCRVDWDDPVNSSNANNGSKTAYVAVVYRTQDTVAATNTMNIYCAVGGPKDTANGGTSSANITCDGTWRTVVVNITSNTGWARTADNQTYDGKRGTDLSYMYITPFSSGTIPGGKSIDIAAVGIFTTSAEASAYGAAYITKNFATQKGVVRVISNANGTVTLTKGGSGTLSSDSTYITGVTAGSTFKVNVTPAAGYYCSKLCWRPTGYRLSGTAGATTTSYFSAGTTGNATTATANHTKVVEYVDVLDTNFINNGMFTGGTTAASGWTNSSWGNNVIMTSGQIKAYNAALVKKYKGTTSSNDVPVDILDMAVKSKITTANIQTYVNTACTEANATTWGLSDAYTNRNYSAINKSNIVYGVVTKRASIRALPYASAYTVNSKDQLQETGIAYGTPVWVLHTSTDGAFYFVQAPYYRGWVDATRIATTSSYMDWIEFADPAIRGDIVVTKARAVTVNSTTAEMGCVFQHVSTSGTTYTVKVPIRNSDGTLGSSTSTALTTSNSSLGYLPYTWNNYVTQAFQYLGQTYSWGDANPGRVDCSSFIQYVLKTFGFNIMRNTSKQAGTGYTDVMNSKSYSTSTDGYYDLAKFGGTPMILTGNGHTVLYLGCVGEKHYIIHSPDVGKTVVVEELTSANLSKWSTYAIYAPNNYLEDAYARKFITTTSKSFTATLETPAYSAYTSSTKYTLNHTVDAVPSTLLDTGTTYVDQYVLNSGGRDIYVWAEFTKLSNEVAVDIQLQIPDGYGCLDYDFGSYRMSDNMKTYATVATKAYGATQNSRLVVYKGYRVTGVVVEGSVTRSTAGVVPANSKGTEDTTTTATYTHEGRGSASEALSVSTSGTLRISYDAVDTLSLTGDGTIRYIIQPTSYTIKYNSNYPTDSGVAATTVTGTHYYNCAGNAFVGTATFVAANGPGTAGWSASKTFSAGANYKFKGWGTNSTTARVSYTADAANATAAKNYLTSGTQGATYNLYAKWQPINYSLSVEYISELDRELIGTPDGFCVKVGSTTLGKNDVVTSQTPLTISLANFGTNVKTNCTASYASSTGILSINSTATTGAACSVDWTYSDTYNIMTYPYMTVTYKLSAGAQSGRMVFKTNSTTYTDYTANTSGAGLNSLFPNWIADNEWHTLTLNLQELDIFFRYSQFLTGICFPGSTTSGATLNISSVKLYKSPPTVWGQSTVSNSSSSSSTALKTQGDYGFVHTINKGVSVNVISAQQSDYDFAMDISKAYMFFLNETVGDSSPVYTSTEYTNSGYNATFGTPASVSINGVSMLGYNVSSYIKNHTFDMSAAKFTMPDCDVRLVFVCDYVKYNVKVFTYTAGTSYTTVPTTSLANTAGSTSKAFTQATVTIASSKNNGIVGRYGSTVALSVSSIASGYKFLGWYEKTKDATTSTSTAYGKLLSSSTSFTLSTNLHKDMDVVAVFGSSTSTNTTFNFCNVSGQVIQTLVAAKGTYIPVTNITAKPFKSGSAFSGWEFLKNADKSKVTSTSVDPDGDGTKSTYYLLNGTTQTTYKYDYSILYSDKNCTTPKYIYVNGAGGTVYIDGAYTKLSTGTVKITMSGTGTINGSTASATVPYDTTVTAVATGTSTFKGWIDKTVQSTRYTPESYYDGTYYYPFISYSKTFKFKALRAMTISPIYASATAAQKMPNVSITPTIQRVNMGTYYKYTAFGMFTADPGSTYKILEWGTLFFMAPDSTTLPTTTSYDKATGVVKTTNILTTDTPSTYLVHLSNSADTQSNPSGQYAASVSVASARTIYVRMYCRYSYTDTTTNETVYVVTYSDTYKFTSAAYASSTANGYVTPTLYATVDLKPSDYDNLF